MENIFTLLFLVTILFSFTNASPASIGDISVIENEVKIKVCTPKEKENSKDLTQYDIVEQDVLSMEKSMREDSVLYYKFHLGEIEQHKKIELDIPFVNNGNEPITIPTCRPNWGGMYPKIEKRALLPGEKSILTLAFHSRNLEGGSIKYATLAVNNTIYKKIVIEMKWFFVAQKTEIEFDYKTSDAGKVKEGSVIEYEFPFTNTGDEPLIIQNCKSSCGCVIPYWPKNPILPGESGVVKAKFSTKARRGKQNKSLTLITNTIPEVTMLRLKAFVE